MYQKVDIHSQVIPIRQRLAGIKTELFSRNGVPKLPLSTLPELNKMIWGVLPKGLLVIAGRSSQGKTSIAMQIAYDIADQHMPVLYMSLEEDVDTLVERLFCNVAEIDNFFLTSGRMVVDEALQAKWATFERQVSAMPLLITDGIGKSFSDIITLLECLQPMPRVIIVDYIQSIRQSVNERMEINEYIRKFREICLKRSITGILVSQMNRTVADNDGKRPELHQLKSTGVLEEHSDQVWLLYWKYHFTREEADKNKYEIIIAKNKHGRTGCHECLYYPQFYKYRDILPEIKELI